MPHTVTADAVGEYVRRLATSHVDSYSLRGDRYWWHFDPVSDRPIRRQGWKLHVSAVPVTALDTVRRVADVVLPLGCRWKVSRSIAQLVAMCTPPSPVSQVGKFITVYVDDGDDTAVAALAAELHAATNLFDGPVVPSDRRYARGSNVYLRYGAFSSSETYRGPEQTRTWVLADPAGRRVEDARAPGRFAPTWVTAPVPAAPRPARGGHGLFGRDIAVLEVLNQSAKGGVYLVERAGAKAVMKEARIGTCPKPLPVLLVVREPRGEQRQRDHPVVPGAVGTHHLTHPTPRDERLHPIGPTLPDH